VLQQLWVEKTAAGTFRDFIARRFVAAAFGWKDCRRKRVCLLDCNDTSLFVGCNTICCSSIGLERLPPVPFVIPLQDDLLQQLLYG
jgi:hypothetical protein